MFEATTAADVLAGLETGADRFYVPAWVPPPVRTEQLDVIADFAAPDPRVVELARKIAWAPPGVRCIYSPPQQAQRLMDAIEQLITYEDGPDFEMFQSVPFTLFSGLGQGISPITGKPKGIGRCSHRTSVFVAFCKALGFNAKARWFQQTGAPRNHVAAWVCDGAQGMAHFGGCFVAEVTIPGARFGEDPYKALDRLGNTHAGRL